MPTIVVGYVPTPEGLAALRRAVSEAKLRGSKLLVVNSHRGGRDFEDEDALRTETQMSEVRDRLHGTGVQHEIRELVRGKDPAEDVVDVAEEVRAELIVIGLRRRSAVGKLLLGSNAQRILLDARCAVLAVKAGG